MCFTGKNRRKMSMMITSPRQPFGTAAALPLKQASSLAKLSATRRPERREEAYMGRADVLRALEDYTTYQAVLNYQPGTSAPRIADLHRAVSNNRLSTEELFGNPRLLANTYRALADEMTREIAETNPAKLSAEEKNLLQGKAMLVQGYRQLAQDLAKKATVTGPLGVVRKGAQAPQPTFSGWAGFLTQIFSIIPKNSYGTLSEDDRWWRANGIIHAGSIIAGGTAGILTKSLIADEAALTTVTVGTIMALSRNVYGVDGEALLATLIGKLIGARIAGAIIKAIPGVGEIANAATAAGFHEAIGWGFYAMYETQITNGEKPHCPKTFKSLLVMTGLAMAFGLEDMLVEHVQEQLFELEQMDFLNHRDGHYITRISGDQIPRFLTAGEAQQGDWFSYAGKNLQISAAPKSGIFQTAAEVVRFIDELKEKSQITLIDNLPIPFQMKEIYKIEMKIRENKKGYDS